MNFLSHRTDEGITLIYEKYADTVYKVCFMLMKNTSDAQDAVQNVFVKLINRPEDFESEVHLKSWLIVVAKNECKNTLKHWFNSKREDAAALEKITYDNKEDNLIDIVFKLPEKYRLPLYLYYYEGYSAEEISGILGIKYSTIRTHLKKGRENLKNIIGGDRN